MKNIRTRFFFTLIVLSLSVSSFKNSDKLDLFFRLSDSYFRKYVHNGLVNYQHAKKNISELKALCQLIGQIDVSGASKEDLKAFYVNAYNLIVIYQVSEVYPINNPLDEDGFFVGKKHLVAGQELTLDELEKSKMLKELRDPRFHFVLACAAMSCPKLANFSYKPENIEHLLNQRTSQALNDNSFVRIDQGNKKVSLSKIFDWYRSDFGQSNSALLSYINKYRKVKIPASYTVDFYKYNWTLNERK